MIIKGGHILLDGVLKRRDILIEDGLITIISKGLKGEDVFDAGRMIVIPGFVNTHSHNAMTLLRGAGDDMPLHEWLSERIWPLESNLTYEDCYWGNLLGIVEMVKTGTTCFNDMYFFMDSAIRAIKETGIRASIGNGMIDLFDEGKAKQELKESMRIYGACEGERLISYCMAPHAPYTCSKELLTNAKELALKNGIRTHIHLSETNKEFEDSIRTHKMTPTEYLDSLSFLDDTVMLAHCVHLTDKDIGIIARSGASVLHCPNSNMKLSSGIARLPDMLNAGTNVSLGTDGAASNNSLDMGAEMKSMALLHKLTSPTDLPAATSLDISTRCGARALGVRSGQVSEGMCADLQFIDPYHHSMLPGHNPLSNIVYSMRPDAIRHVMVDGTFLMEDRQMVAIDEATVYERALECAEALLGRLS